MIDHRTLPRKRLYDWPNQPNEPVAFAQRKYEETLYETVRRVCNAAGMKYQKRKLGWRFHTWRGNGVVWFIWLKPEDGQMAQCDTCKNSGKPGWVKKSYPAPKGVIYGFAPYWPCPNCQGSAIQHCCEGEQAQAGQAAD